MARSARKSLTSTASAVARKALGRTRASGADTEKPATKSGAKPTASKAAKKTAAKKSATKQAAAKKTTTKKSATKQAAAKKSAAKKSATKQSAAKKTTTKKTATKQAATKKTTTAKTATKTAGTKPAATTTSKATKAAPKKAPAKKSPAKKASGPIRNATDSRAKVLPVREGEQAWTKADLAEVLDDLHEHRDRIQALLREHESELAGLMRDAGDGAGQDQADVGNSSFERDQEMTVVNNEREMLEQIDTALAKIADGTYGVCASCGEPIGKGRLMAFPRAGLCLTCKQREERR